MLIANELRVNGQIRAKEVRVVAPDGSQIGVQAIDAAMYLADQLGLDLVEVAPEARPPVCKLMDYGKYKYDESVKRKMNRKQQKRTVIKEVKLRPKIDDHDFDVKARRAIGFLEEEDKVKVTMMFRGREVTHPEIGRQLLDKMSQALSEHGSIEVMPRLEGRNMTMVIAPLPAAQRKERKSDEPEVEETAVVEAAAPAEEAAPTTNEE